MGEDRSSLLELTDATLLERVQNGDQRAFDGLFYKHHDGVYALLFRLTGSREEAEDLTQETFVRLYRQSFAASHEHNVGAWLYRVALNLGFNGLRGKRRSAGREQNYSVLEGPSTLADPAEQAERSDERRRVRAVLVRLPERQAACLLLRHSGFSYREIASVLGIPGSSVGTTLVRAEQRFKELYLQEDKE